MMKQFDIENRLEEENKILARLRFAVKDPGDTRNLDDLKEDIELCKSTIRTLKWVLIL